MGGWLAVLFLFSPLGGDMVFDSPYSTSFRLSMIIVLAFEMATCYILDQSRRRSKLGLIRLAAEFEYAAKHDALTSLANRREGLEQLETEYQRYLRNGRSFSVLLMDIDLFKNVNDSYGHQAGDDMIVLVARTVTGQSRKVDTIARWGGGEEFLVLLPPETALTEAAATAERIRSAVASQGIDCAGKRVTATISIGVACIQARSRSIACCNGPMRRCIKPRRWGGEIACVRLLRRFTSPDVAPPDCGPGRRPARSPAGAPGHRPRLRPQNH